MLIVGRDRPIGVYLERSKRERPRRMKPWFAIPGRYLLLSEALTEDLFGQGDALGGEWHGLCFALEIVRRQGEHPDVFVLRSPPGNDLVQSRDGVLLAAVGRECLVEAAYLAGSPVRMDYALARGFVVLHLGLVSDAAGLLLVPRLDCPVEALGEVAKAGPDALVVGATLDALLVAFGWCGHAGSSNLILT